MHVAKLFYQLVALLQKTDAEVLIFEEIVVHLLDFRQRLTVRLDKEPHELLLLVLTVKVVAKGLKVCLRSVFLQLVPQEFIQPLVIEVRIGTCLHGVDACQSII